MVVGGATVVTVVVGGAAMVVTVVAEAATGTSTTGVFAASEGISTPTLAATVENACWIGAGRAPVAAAAAVPVTDTEATAAKRAFA
jgi:hypothetical protein